MYKLFMRYNHLSYDYLHITNNLLHTHNDVWLSVLSRLFTMCGNVVFLC